MSKLQGTGLEDCPERFELKTRIFERLEKLNYFKLFLILVFVYLFLAIPFWLVNETVLYNVCYPACEDEGFDLVGGMPEWVFVDGVKCQCYHSNLRYTKEFLVKDTERILLREWSDCVDCN